MCPRISRHSFKYVNSHRLRSANYPIRINYWYICRNIFYPFLIITYSQSYNLTQLFLCLEENLLLNNHFKMYFEVWHGNSNSSWSQKRELHRYIKKIYHLQICVWFKARASVCIFKKNIYSFLELDCFSLFLSQICIEYFIFYCLSIQWIWARYQYTSFLIKVEAVWTWQTTVHRVTKSQTRLKQLST